MLWTFPSALFRITHLNYHGLLKFEYHWLRAIFLLLNIIEVIISAKIWEGTEKYGFPAPALPHYLLWVLRVHFNTGPRQHQKRKLLLLIYASIWWTYFYQVYYHETILMIRETQIFNVVIKSNTLKHIFRELAVMMVVNHRAK